MRSFPMMLSSSAVQQSCLHVENGVVLHLQRRSHLKKKQQNLKRPWNKCFAVGNKEQHRLRKDDRNLLSVSLRFFSDVPLYEPSGRASFDQYLEDKPRLVKATFPGKSQQLNQEEWRIGTPKIQLLFLKIWPTIDMKIISKTSGEGYPSDVPHHVTKVLEFEMINWEINGIHIDYKPSSATVYSRGAMYTEKIGTRSRLKLQLLINLSFLVPNALNFLPINVLRSIFETCLKAMIEDLKDETIDKLVEDYCEFRKEEKK